ncbi:MAG: ribosome maturation factor RimM [Armatimonadota bacterium]|jgi:16S rRNA processing protein RimM
MGDTEEEPWDLTVGKVVGAHGVGGELKVLPLTDFPEHIYELERVLLAAPDGPGTVTEIDAIRAHKNVLLVKLACVPDRTTAEALRGATLAIKRSMGAPLPEGHYYIDDIIGLRVVTTDGEVVGDITDVLRTGANDVYVTERVLIPAIPDVVKSVDLEAGQLTIEPMEGLL